MNLDPQSELDEINYYIYIYIYLLIQKYPPKFPRIHFNIICLKKDRTICVMLSRNIFLYNPLIKYLQSHHAEQPAETLYFSILSLTFSYINK